MAEVKILVPYGILYRTLTWGAKSTAILEAIRSIPTSVGSINDRMRVTNRERFLSPFKL